MKLKHLYISIMGFSQKPGKLTGSEKLWEKVKERLNGQPGTHAIWPLPWNHNWKGLAKRIDRLLDPDGRIVVVAYSWGAGWGMRKLVKLIQPRKVNQLILIDPIYRSDFLPTWAPLNFRSLAFWKTVKSLHVQIPSNVDDVLVFRQVRDRKLRGHEIVVESPSTRTQPHIIIGTDHAGIDDHEDVHAKIVELLAG